MMMIINLQNIKKQYCWFCAVLFIVADKVGMSAKPGGIGTWGSKSFLPNAVYANDI